MKKIKITQDCLWAEGTEMEVHESTAKHLIEMGYATEIPIGQSGQNAPDKKKSKE